VTIAEAAAAVRFPPCFHDGKNVVRRECYREYPLLTVISGWQTAVAAEAMAAAAEAAATAEAEAVMAAVAAVMTTIAGVVVATMTGGALPGVSICVHTRMFYSRSAWLSCALLSSTL
jgi:hypothetical protein